ncbi:MAG: class I SAM-dependent methyltransferase [Bacteroidota bacterium]
MNQVSQIYDQLFEFEKEKKSGEAYPIHKKLDFSKLEGVEGFEDITDLIFDLFPKGDCLRILDAGCGVGYSLTQICAGSHHWGLGISLSKKELTKAREIRERNGLGNKLAFRQLSFDDEMGGTFDVILAMESLKHAPSWRNSYKNLAAHLKVGGHFFVLEDYAATRMTEKAGTRFQELWSVPELYTEREFLSESNVNQLKLISRIELDQALDKKSAFMSKALARTTAFIASFIGKGKWKELLRIYEGGLWMDYLYARNKFRYRLLQFEKQG